MASPLVVPVTELLRHPGSRRELQLEVPADGLTLGGEASVPDGAVIDVDIVVESLIDGITVNGEARAEWRGTCGRCLGPATGPLAAEVQELYQVDPSSEEAFSFDGEQLDLEPMVRELVLMELPLMPLCRVDCAGLCPVCGVDRNRRACECVTTEADPRWAVLDQLRSAPEPDH